MKKNNKMIKEAFIIITATAILTVIFGEIFIRISGKAPRVSVMERNGYRLSSNKLIGYEPVSNYDQNNQYGFRDRNHSKTKEPGTTRIIIIGDSLVAGAGIAAKENLYSALLEKKLIKNGYRAEVINFGVQGYNTQQEIELYKDRGIQFDADIIILSYCLNDKGMVSNSFDIFAGLLNADKNTIYFQEVNQYLLESHLLRFIYYTYKSRIKVEDPFAKFKDYESLVEDRREIYFKELSLLAKLKKQKVIVVIFPLFGPLPIYGVNESNIFNYKFYNEHEFVKKISMENNFTSFDLLESFRICAAKNPNIALDVYHPSAIGQECASDAIYSFLTNHNILQIQNGDEHKYSKY